MAIMWPAHYIDNLDPPSPMGHPLTNICEAHACKLSGADKALDRGPDEGQPNWPLAEELAALIGPPLPLLARQLVQDAS